MVSLADLATPTVAALVPDGWQISICDERVQPVDFDTDAEIVGITGKVSQRDRMVALAAEFRRRGKTVMIGGPYASLNPDDMRPHADVLVRGEIEEIAPALFADMADGSYKPEYLGTRPDLTAAPLPRWDLYPKGVAFTAQVQTSRGCPFECEFCDVIQYLGRKQRWKTPGHIIEELNQLHGLGYRSVFFADDNMTVMRRRIKEFLQQLIAWNDANRDEKMSFSTQLSIDVTRDAEILGLLRQANFDAVFIGIETVNEESLAETHKRQNLRVDLRDELDKIAGAGILPTCGIIVGFDSDGPDIFERQAHFIQSLPVPLLTIGLLVAPHSTPLYERIKAEGRLLSDARLGAANCIQTNIRPLRMSTAALEQGMRWLINRVYAPGAMMRRIDNFAERCASRGAVEHTPLFEGFLGILAERLAAYGPEEAAFLEALEQANRRRPDLKGPLSNSLIFYCQFRHMFEQGNAWDPELGRYEFPNAA